jgi:signal transduction histidine kinase
MIRDGLQYDKILTAVYQINDKLLSGYNRDLTLQYIANSAMEVFGADSCTIWRYDIATRSFVSEAAAGLSTGWAHEPRAHGVGSQVMEKGGHAWVTDTQQLHPAILEDNITCVGCFPLHPKEANPVGLMYLHYRTDPRFTEKEHDIVYLFSYHAGLAIQLAELRENDARRIKDLETLRDASAFVGDSLTLRDSLERVTKIAVNVMHADGAILYPWEKKTGRFNKDLIVADQLDMGKFEVGTPRPNGITSWIMNEGVLWVNDAEEVSEDMAERIKYLKEYVLSVYGFRSFIGIALKSGNEPLGVLYVLFREPHKPEQEELSTLHIFADLAATRIQLAKLSEAQTRAAAAEAISILNIVAAQFAHRLSNVAGTVPMVIEDIKSRMNAAGVADSEIFRRLEDLRNDTVGLMRMARHLRLKDIGSPVPVDISSVVQKAIRAAAVERINPDITVNVDMPDRLNQVSGVETLLIDILVNLLQNAAKANARSIHVQAAERPEDTTVELIVSNDGDIIPEADQARIFMPFYSTRRTASKEDIHGVGLWVARNQIAQMGGRISVKSTLGVGTAFVISLPQYRDQSEGRNFSDLESGD